VAETTEITAHEFNSQEITNTIPRQHILPYFSTFGNKNYS